MAHSCCVELKKSKFHIFFPVVFRLDSHGTYFWSFLTFPFACHCFDTVDLLTFKSKALKQFNEFLPHML